MQNQLNGVYIERGEIMKSPKIFVIQYCCDGNPKCNTSNDPESHCNKNDE